MLTRIFVFGTLKEGFPNFATNRGRRVEGEFQTCQRLPLYLVGERFSPWLIDQPGEGFQVAGQVFEVDAATLALMDQLERTHEPDGYVRQTINVQDRFAANALALQVQAYLKPAAQLAGATLREGPLAEYSLAHAALYRSRMA